MSVRASDSGKPPAPPPLKKWPKAPATFTPAEKVAWEEVGAAVMVLQTASAADLILAARAARVMARVSALFDDVELKPSTLSSMLRIEMDILKQLGLSPQARRQVAPLRSTNDGVTGFEDIE